MMKILKNKKVLIIIGVVFVVGLAALYLYLQKQRSVDVDDQGDRPIVDDDAYQADQVDDALEDSLLEDPLQDDLYEEKEVGGVSIKLPQIWNNDVQDYSQENHEYVYIKSSSINDSFVFDAALEYVPDEEIVNYQSENIDNQSLYSPIDNYKEEDFEVISIKNGQTLLVSKLGCIKYEDSVVVGTELILDYPNYVFQKYEREDGTFGITFVLTAFDERIDKPMAYQGTIISYTFHSQQEMGNWDEYKKVLAKSIESMQ